VHQTCGSSFDHALFFAPKPASIASTPPRTRGRSSPPPTRSKGAAARPWWPPATETSTWRPVSRGRRTTTSTATARPRTRGRSSLRTACGHAPCARTVPLTARYRYLHLLVPSCCSTAAPTLTGSCACSCACPGLPLRRRGRPVGERPRGRRRVRQRPAPVQSCHLRAADGGSEGRQPAAA
jgi:hypothetical protein